MNIITAIPPFKLKPSFLKFTGIFYNSAQAVFGSIWVPEYLYEKIQNNDLVALAILEHEKVHLQRVKEVGATKWYFFYAFSRKFRLAEEILAIEAEFKFLQSHNLPINIEAKAQWLSSWLYLKMISYEEALERLKGIL